MNADEFKMKYCMSREMLDSVTDIIKDSKVFKKGKRGPSQRPVKHQLMVFLHLLGLGGQNYQSQRNIFHISRGSCRLCRDRVVKALVPKYTEFIQWPDAEEQKEIASKIENNFCYLIVKVLWMVR